MKIISQSEAFLYNKKGFNSNMVNSGTSVDMGELYEYLKRNKKEVKDLSRQEFLMFKGKNK